MSVGPSGQLLRVGLPVVERRAQFYSPFAWLDAGVGVAFVEADRHGPAAVRELLERAVRSQSGSLYLYYSAAPSALVVATISREPPPHERYRSAGSLGNP